jgi:hypothetical protein
MNSCVFHMGSAVTHFHAALGSDGSFIRQSETVEHVSKYCLISEGAWSGSGPH